MNSIFGISRAALVLCAVGFCLQLSVALQAAAVNSVWTRGNGNWSERNNWIPNAAYPNDGNGGQTFNVRISGAVTLTDWTQAQRGMGDAKRAARAERQVAA